MENASKALIIAGAILISILLISIGIILINSGRDITSTGASQMQSQKISAFNNKFLAYEGIKKGSEISGLVNEANASNATDSEHKVIVYATGISAKNAGDFTPSGSYYVQIGYCDGRTTAMGEILTAEKTRKSEKGYIDYIMILPVSQNPNK